MKLTELLKQDIKALKPTAMVMIDDGQQMTARTVVYQPEILNLGAVLLGYYFKPQKIERLNQMGDCLSIGHYLRAPRALKYGLDFKNNDDFQELPAKMQAHLTGELQDCTLNDARDFRLDRPVHKVNDLRKFLDRYPSINYGYFYQGERWQVLRSNGRELNHPVSLKAAITKALKKA